MTTLFSPFDLSGLTLPNRVVMAPMTRSRAPHDIADELTVLYYKQRASAGLIISEGTPVSREGQGYAFIPGIYSQEQVAGWRRVTDAVRDTGGRMFAQIWHVGRVSHTSLQENGNAPASATSKIARESFAFGFCDDGKPGLVPASPPRPFETQEIGRVVQDFANAAANAVAAGFDGVEIHGANGYLFEQFLNPQVNDRTDHYGADTMENRLRFTLEVVDAVVARIGREKVGLRISPFGELFDMPPHDEVEETYNALAGALGPKRLAYVHIMDQSGFDNVNGAELAPTTVKLLALLRVFRSSMPQTALIFTGGMNRERADAMIADGTIDLAGFGKAYISNPDLVERLRDGLPLATPDPTTFYGGDEHGYTDYPAYAGATG